MRAITEDAVDSLYNGEYFKRDNTEVIHGLDGAKMYLHGNLIAILNGAEISLYSCGWKTKTTKERLNGCINQYRVQIIQRKGKWFISDSNGPRPFEEGVVVDLDIREIK